MKMVRWTCVAMAVCFVAGCGEQPQQESATEARLQIAVIPKATAHPFWKTVHAGAEKAAQELGVEAIWVGAENESDRRQQIELVQNFVSRGVDAIVLAPLDEVALVRPVENAVGRGIPVVIIDSNLKSDAYSSFVATDNREGGRLGARRLAEVMGGTGRAVMLRYSEGHASTMNREEGFLEVMKTEYPEIELVSTNQYAGVTKESAIQASQNLLNRFPDIDGIFCPNESSAFGMLRSLQTSGKAGTIKYVGFDASEALVEGVRAGEIDGLVAQDPFNMGYMGVQTAVKVINGEPVEKRIPTRVAVITPDNLDEPEIRQLIEPELEKWLD